MRKFNNEGVLQLDNKRIKDIELQILNEVSQFCEKNGIQYYLYYGTLLGAVRHNGFLHGQKMLQFIALHILLDFW